MDRHANALTPVLQALDSDYDTLDSSHRDATGVIAADDDRNAVAGLMRQVERRTGRRCESSVE